MLYFTPSNLPLAASLHQDSRVFGVESKWMPSISTAASTSAPGPWLRGQKSCTFLRELYQRAQELRASTTLARVDHSLELASTRRPGVVRPQTQDEGFVDWLRPLGLEE